MHCQDKFSTTRCRTEGRNEFRANCEIRLGLVSTSLPASPLAALRRSIAADACDVIRRKPSIRNSPFDDGGCRAHRGAGETAFCNLLAAFSGLPWPSISASAELSRRAPGGRRKSRRFLSRARQHLRLIAALPSTAWSHPSCRHFSRLAEPRGRTWRITQISMMV